MFWCTQTVVMTKTAKVTIDKKMAGRAKWNFSYKKRNN